MKDYTQNRNYYKFAGSCIGLGAACIMISGVLTGFSFNGMNSGGAYKERVESYDTAEVSSLVIEDDNASVILKKSDSNQIAVHLQENSQNTYTTEVRNGTLYVTKDADKDSHVFSLEIDQSNLVVEIPETILDSISVTTSDSSVEASDINTGSLAIVTSDGSITISDVTAEKDITLKDSNASLNLDTVRCEGTLKAVTSNASVNAEDVQAGDMNLTTSNGSMNCDTLNADTAKLSTSNAHVEAYQVTVMKSFEAVTSNGHIEGSLTGNENDYSYSCKTSNGTCNVPSGNGAKSITLKSSNASINFEIE